MSERQRVPLGELAASDGFAVGPFGSRMKTEHYTASGARVLRGTNITNDGRIAGQFVYVSDEFADSLGSARLRAGDIALPHRGAIGRAALVKSDDLVMSTSLMRVRVDRALAEPSFIAAFLASDAGRHELLQFASTVGTPGIGQPLASLRKVRIPLPSLEEQRRIAAVLGALDDLIETNRRQVIRLEELARVVVARTPEEVELGEFAGTLDSRQVRPAGPVEYYSLPAFDEGAEPERGDGEQIQSNKLPLTEPCVLISRLNPRWERCWMAYPGANAVASTEFVPLVGREATPEEVWAVTSAPAFWEQMRTHVTGTTGSHQRVGKSAVLTLTVPNVRHLDESARRHVQHFVRGARAARDEIVELTRARDELLPLLMSGQVRVSEDLAVA